MPNYHSMDTKQLLMAKTKLKMEKWTIIGVCLAVLVVTIIFSDVGDPTFLAINGGFIAVLAGVDRRLRQVNLALQGK